jgi:hypothetical protein
VKPIRSRDKSDATKTETAVDRRQAKRIPISFPIEISGFDDAGRLFRECTVTTDVSEQGCKFDLLRELKRGSVVAIQLVSRTGERLDKSKPLLFEIAWADASVRGWTMGASKLQPENIWHLAFPAKKLPSP